MDYQNESHAHTGEVVRAPKRFRLRAYTPDEDFYAIVEFSPELLTYYACLHEQVVAVAVAAFGDDFHSLRVWTRHNVAWAIEDYEVEHEDVETVDEIIDEDSAQRTEYDVTEIDQQGIVFQADLRHTDTTLATARLEWSKLFGGVS